MYGDKDYCVYSDVASQAAYDSEPMSKSDIKSELSIEELEELAKYEKGQR